MDIYELNTPPEDDVGIEIPSSMARCADMYYELRKKRLALEAEAAKVGRQEQVIKKALIVGLPKDDATGVSGKLVRVSVVTKAKIHADDWDVIREFIMAHHTEGAFSIMNRALNPKAVKDLLDAGVPVPGVSQFNVIDLSVSKL